MTESRKSSPERYSLHLPVLAVFVFVAILIYYPALNAPFILDDWGDIQANAHIRMTELSLDSIVDAAWRSPFKTRPVAYISFALNHLVHGYHVAGFHMVNIGLHIATAFILYLFIRTILAMISESGFAEKTGIPGRITSIAFWGALLWLVHPVNTSSVNYVVQRMNGLAAMFFVLSLLLYLNGRRTQSRTGAIVLFTAAVFAGLLGLGSKEICATLPLFVILMEGFFLGPLDRRRIFYFLIAGLFALGLIVLAGFAATEGQLIQKIIKIHTTRAFGLGEGLMTGGRSMIYYLSLLVWPHPFRLNPDHDYPLSLGCLTPATTIPAFMALGCLIAFAVFIVRRNRLAAFALFWFIGNLAIESSGLPNETMFEHRIYLPAMLLFPAVVAWMMNNMEKTGRGMMALTFSAAVIVLALWTFDRNRIWSEPLAFWRDCAMKSPQSARVQSNYGKAFLETRRPVEAKTVFYRALQYDPAHAPAHNNLAMILAGEGNLLPALRHIETAARLEPASAVARMNLGIVLNRMGRFEEALASFQQALRLAPDDDQTHFALANCLADFQKPAAAIRQYQNAIRLNPNLAEAHHNLGVVLAETGHPDLAIHHFKIALELSPGNRVLLDHLRRAREEAGLFEP